MRTSGSLTIGERVLTVAPEQSFGWYDRQAGFGAPANWTWFQLHFLGSLIKASIWACDLFVLDYNLKADWENTWTSYKTNITYSQSWQLVFENGDRLEVESLRPYQETYGPNAIGDSVYAGTILDRGSFFGQRTTYGLVEMITISA
ncbi:hypothetical protein PFICI_06915 [Pestalotiopsis fici W106-1]|uniref:AttH domain-containing protein n=1 Tax=Pestalotiopsis fici (strain W106-1 / CGMCC3.15140) TaxID=1229662 RepID=W3X724_PESFW|nr:uncharacterized protein PFICI_06915 [Pestalotiopsis fici W106-1]ETS81913.1 hypothetical protein PFICI_06915 [Pestalotiopsis fici W106-1]